MWIAAQCMFNLQRQFLPLTKNSVTFLREKGSSLARLTIGEEYDADQDEACEFTTNYMKIDRFNAS